MVALLQCLLSQALPALGAIDGLGGLEGDIEIAALYGQVESGIFVLHEVECNLEHGQA